MLLSCADRHHQLLCADLAPQLAAAVDADVLLPLEVKTEVQHAELAHDLGLPWQLEGAGEAERERW